MKNWIIIFTFTISTLLGRKVTVKLATLAPEGTHVHSMLLEIGQEWRNLTKGKVRMKIYAGGIVGDERDMVRKMRIGQIHAAAMTSEGLSEIIPQFAGFFIPLVFQTYEDIDKVKDALLPGLKNKMDDQGFKLLNLNDFGWVYWFSKNTIKVPSDLKKQKFFTWAGDFRWAELWNEAGYKPIPLASTDILSSLQTGLINTLPTMPIYALSQQSFGIANRMLNLKWGVVMAGIIIDNKTWERIPKKFHSDMILMTEKILERNQNKNREAGEKAIKVMVENGLKIYEPSIEEIRIWEQEVNKFDSLLKKELIPKDTYKKVVELIKN